MLDGTRVAPNHQMIIHIFFFGNGKANHHLGTSFFVRRELLFQVYAPAEDKSDCTKNIFYEQQEHVLDQFPEYYMKLFMIMGLE
jgi:hypothetical protein